MYLKILSIALLLSLPTFAQQPRNIEVRALCFEYSNNVREASLASDPLGEAKVGVKLFKYLKPKQQEMTILTNEIFVGSGNAEFKVWSKVQIPEKMTQALLVFFPSGNSDQPYQVKVFDDSVKAFPVASFQIANVSPTSLRLIIGGTPVEIPAGGSKLISEFKKKKSNGQVSYYAYYLEGTDWKRLSTGFWDVIANKRSFQVAYGDSSRKSVSLRGYDDGLPILRELNAKRQAQKGR